MFPKRLPSIALAQPYLPSFGEHMARRGLQGFKRIPWREPENYRSQTAMGLGCFGLSRSGGEVMLGSVGLAQAALRKPKGRCV